MDYLLLFVFPIIAIIVFLTRKRTGLVIATIRFTLLLIMISLYLTISKYGI